MTKEKLFNANEDFKKIAIETIEEISEHIIGTIDKIPDNLIETFPILIPYLYSRELINFAETTRSYINDIKDIWNIDKVANIAEHASKNK